MNGGSFQAQYLIVWGEGLGGKPYITMCRVACQRMPPKFLQAIHPSEAASHRLLIAASTAQYML